MSDFKSILVHADNSPRAAQRYQVARQLADAFDAQVVADYCVTPALMRYPMAIESGGGAVAMMAELDDEQRAKARALFRQHSADSPRLSWTEQLADMPWGFVSRALYADLLVLGQRDPEDATAGDLPGDFLSSVLVGSGKPALILPYAGPVGAIGKTVVVAWKATRESARALHEALPWLRRAGQVHLLTYGDSPETPLASARAYLKCHGVEATTHACGPEEGDAAENLLSRAADFGADLLVMGCYGHSRAREFVLGGMSRTMLQSMTVPVLMAH